MSLKRLGVWERCFGRTAGWCPDPTPLGNKSGNEVVVRLHLVEGKLRERKGIRLKRGGREADANSRVRFIGSSDA